MLAFNYSTCLSIRGTVTTDLSVSIDVYIHITAARKIFSYTNPYTCRNYFKKLPVFKILLVHFNLQESLPVVCNCTNDNST